MYCRNCGKEIEENAKFCSSCGTNTTGEIFSFNYEKTSNLPPVNSSYFYGTGVKVWFIFWMIVYALVFLYFASILISDNYYVKYAVAYAYGKWVLPFAMAECLAIIGLLYALLTKKAKKYFYALCILVVIDFLCGFFTYGQTLRDIISSSAFIVITYLILRKYWDDMD